MEVKDKKAKKIYNVSKDCCVSIVNKCEESGLSPSEFVAVAALTAYSAARAFLVSGQKDGEEIDTKAIDEQTKKMVTEFINLL